jgi:hypothetical protein
MAPQTTPDTRDQIKFGKGLPGGPVHPCTTDLIVAGYRQRYDGRPANRDHVRGADQPAGRVVVARTPAAAAVPPAQGLRLPNVPGRRRLAAHGGRFHQTHARGQRRGRNAPRRDVRARVDVPPPAGQGRNLSRMRHRHQPGRLCIALYGRCRRPYHVRNVCVCIPSRSMKASIGRYSSSRTGVRVALAKTKAAASGDAARGRVQPTWRSY